MLDKYGQATRHRQELDRLPQADCDKVLAFIRLLQEARADAAVGALAAESALKKDWLEPEEDAAWANL